MGRRSRAVPSTVERFSGSNTFGALTTLHSFAYNTVVYGGLVQTADGSFFGTVVDARLFPGGMLFKLDAAGVFSVVHSFSTDSGGRNPFAGLTRGPGGSLYGTTQLGGSFGHGTVFKLDAAGTFTKLHNFRDSISGANPGPISPSAPTAICTARRPAVAVPRDGVQGSPRRER